MTNEEYAIELAENIAPYDIGGDNATHYAAKDAALDMADWKDEQHAKEKQQWIEKACIEFCNNCNEKYGNCEEWCKRKSAFKKAMEGE